MSPLADKQSCHEAATGATESAKLALAVCPRAQPCRRTGQRNIPCKPSSFVKVTPTHPELLQGGLTTPPSTTLAGVTSHCPSVVSSPPPAWMTPHTPSLQPFTFDDGALLSSRGGERPYIPCARTFSSSMEANKMQVLPESHLSASSASRSQSIYCEWMSLSGGGGYCCFLFFWRHLGNLLPPVLFGGTWAILLLHQISHAGIWDWVRSELHTQ